MRKIQTFIILSGVAALALTAFSVNANADPVNSNADKSNKVLKGKWEFVQTRTCIRSSSGFGPNLESLGSTFRITSQSQGTTIFDGVGSGTLSSVLTVINMSGDFFASLAIAEALATCTFDYNVNADNSFNIENMDCSSTTVKGAGVGNVVTVSGGKRVGQIGRKRNSYVFHGPNTAVVETLNFTPPAPGFPFTTDQICIRHTTAVKKK